MSGYDQFFKEAGKASGLRTGKPVAGKSAPTKSAPGKPRFAMKQAPAETAEDRLRKEVALRARNRKTAKQRKKQKFPLFAAVIAVVATLSCTIGFLKPELADQLMAQVASHVDIGFLGQAKASDKAKAGAKKDSKANAAVAAPAAGPGAKSADGKTTPEAIATLTGDAAKTDITPDVKSWSTDELSFFNKLNDRKKELDLREAELTKLEEELQKQKAELDDKIKQLEAMRGDISKTLKTRVAVDQEKVEKLVQFYSTMKPPQAAKVIESLNEDLAVEVMDKMKKKNAAEIMNALDAKKARRLSELLTGYERTPSSTSASDKSADE